ncbi:phage tail tape measure protein, lambda family [Bartonella apis]|uniref:tape measure protein n=1 Tax=Bartonella apis TaxID=1686310 RepID=UPI0009676DD4|nr:tape measure protein [Bartonella apis]OLY45108.1 phage tail tape measure protein, lambda family [Bartonella apis]
MADDLQRMIVQISADVRDFEKSMAKLEGMTNSTFKAITRQARENSKALDNVFKELGNKASASLAAIGAAVGTKELIGLSDTWTTLSNKVAAVSQSTGMQARSMSDLVKGADEARAGIESYTDLYAKLMRSASGVAKNEEEIARATNIVSKAFVAGGAAASEQAAAVLQLGQALASGNLQGDELRSIRENAPLLAEAIAKEFNTTIGGLKDLGAEGKLTTDRVFKAILEAGNSIEQQFAATSATMADGFTRIRNALVEFVGIGGQASGVSQSVTQGLMTIADNFDKVADAGMIVVGVLAGQLVGRAIPALISKFADAGVSAKKFFEALKAAQSLGGVLTAIGGAGPLFALGGAVVGGAALLALNDYMQKSAAAAERTKALNQELQALGLVSNTAQKSIDELAASTNKIGSAENIRKIGMIKEEISRLTNGSMFGTEDELTSILSRAQKLNVKGDDAKALVAIKEYIELVKKIPSAAVRGEEAMQNLRDSLDLTEPMAKMTYEVQNTMTTIRGLIIDAQIKGEDLISPAVKEQVDAFRDAFKDVLDSSDAFSDETRAQLLELWDEFARGEISAEELKQKFQELGATYALIQNKLYPAFQNLTAELGNVKAAADEVRESVEQLTEVKFATIVSQSPSGAYFDQYDNDQKAQAEYKKMVEERAKKTAKQLKLEQEFDRQKTLYEKKNGPGSWDRVPYKEQLYYAETWLKGDEALKKPKQPKQPKESDYERVTKNLNERTETIKAETAAQAQLNPFVNDYGFAMEKARAKQELLNAAMKSKIPIDDKTIANIDEISTKLATASAESAKLAEAQEKMRQRLEAVKDASKDCTRTFIDGMIQGKNATEAAGDAIMRLGQRLLDAGLDAIYDKVFTVQGSKTSSGGFLGGIGKLFGFDEGGFTGNGGRHDPAGIVHRGEFVFSQDAVKAIGVENLEAMHNQLKGYSNGGLVGGGIPAMRMPQIPTAASLRNMRDAKAQNTGVHITFGFSADNNGNIKPFVEKVSQQIMSSGIEQYDRVLDHTVGVKLANGRAMGRFE